MVTSAVPSATTTTTTSGTSKAALNSDFDTFLKMMTVQMKNQDPLDPVESADYAMQLATFSGVEQQIKTNTLLEGLNSQFSVMGMAQLAAWVGQEARSSAPVAFDGSAVTISYSAAATADRAVLVVKNSDGTVVAREDVPVGSGEYQWLGGDATGNALPVGFYNLSLENYKGDQQLAEQGTVESYASIIEARSGANGATLVLAGGIEVPATEITALRVP